MDLLAGKEFPAPGGAPDVPGIKAGAKISAPGLPDPTPAKT
jgi:hypothetical protein